MNKLDLSIIILSYKTKDTTKNCLDSILKSLKTSSLNYEIIIVDNHSTDGSLELLNKYSVNYSNIRIIENITNLGFGKANNQGVEIAKSDNILFLNSDILV